jgi:hypothetical protein
VRKGRDVRLDWEHVHARIDDRVYHPPKSGKRVEITHDDCALRVLVPELAPTED